MSMSNISEVVAWLNGFVDSFDFKRPDVEGSLGRDMIHLGAQRMRDRSLQDRTGFGTAWPPNSETPSHWAPQGYRKWREENYGTPEPNSRTGQILSQLSMEGRSTVESKQVTMIYGIDKPPDGAQFGSPDREAARARPEGRRRPESLLCAYRPKQKEDRAPVLPAH